MNNKNIGIVVIIVLLVGVSAFYGGIIYQKKQIASQNLSRGENNGDFQKGGMRSSGKGEQRIGQNNNSGAFENGEVISKDDKSITIKTRDGGSRIIYFSDSTTIGKTVNGSVSDLNIGSQIMVNGKNDSSGIITAENIQIRPAK